MIGIGIAFTPCVLPMYPLISGIVLGGKRRLSTARALLLTFIYVQGMALTYTALGLVVAAAGLQSRRRYSAHTCSLASPSSLPCWRCQCLACLLYNSPLRCKHVSR
ncbi:cytochrome c biogenesis protein CcdA [Escherichia coli]